MRSAKSGRPARRKRTKSSAQTGITPACPRQHAEQVRQSSSASASVTSAGSITAQASVPTAEFVWLFGPSASLDFDLGEASACFEVTQYLDSHAIHFGRFE